MPVYGTLSIPAAIYPGDQSLLIGTLTNPSTPLSSAVGEAQGVGAAATNALSERVALSGPWDMNASKQVEWTLIFSANPGTFEYDLMGSDSDALGAQSYTIIATADKISTAAVSPVTGATLYIATFNLINLTNRFVAIFCKTQPTNTCTTIAIVSR